ncbi:MAG: carbohydrate porin [Planctomycetota bacterium]|jgi:porin
MNGTKILPTIFLLSTLATVVYAGHPGSEKIDNSNPVQSQSLTDRLLGLNDALADKGIELELGLTQIYQQNVRGGISKHRRSGRFSGSYDMELSADLQQMLGLESGALFLHLEGGWPDTEGIDEVSVGSAFGVNVDAIGNRSVDVKQLFYEGPIFGSNLTLMIGKIDFTGVFDSSAYADDECTQFLNAAFVDDPTIPFPQYSLGAALTYDLTDSWYLMGGIADAQADGRETGFRTTFHDEDYFFYIFETGVTSQLSSARGPLQGAYRAGLWYDPRDKEKFSDSKIRRDDTGFYLSCDQMLYRESGKDDQGLGLFGRYGWASSKVNEVTNFWSAGFQYQGLLEGRNDDVLGFGFAQGIFSDKASSTYTDDYENAFELYYNVLVTPWLNISPSIQYIANPGGDRTASDAVVLGVRAQIRF